MLRLTKEQQQLVEENHSLIYYCLNKIYCDRDELYGIAAIGLCKAAATYNRNISKFSTYAVRCITNELKMYNRLKSSACRIPGNEITSMDSPNSEGLCLRDSISSHDRMEQFIVTKTALQDVVKSKKQRQIVQLVVLGYTQKEVAELVGCSQPHVSRVMNEIRAQMEGEVYAR